ncbi:MAG TPA: (deoxy)nucleoside triphosphate pyrophosphohydrolase [Allosphingosinicella sp.]|jgi:8-oxo-dGTP diphosphatase
MLIVVAAALVNDEGRVLLQQRRAGRDMEGLWEFPGGKLEAGEGLEEALARELREELGIEVEPQALMPAAFATAENGKRRMLLLLYIGREWRGSPRALDAAALRWVRPAEMHALPMPPADEPLVAALKSMI